MPRSRVYINIHIIDASEAIREAVKTEVKKTGLPFKALAVRAAKRIATPKRIAKHICSKIMKKLRLKMEEEGVTVHIEKVFRKGSYTVMQLYIQHVDAVVAVEMQLIRNGFGSSTVASWLQWFFERIIGPKYQHRIENNLLPRMVQRIIPKLVDESVNERLVSKRIEFESQVLSEEKQARYFFDKLKEVRQSKESNSDSEDSSIDSSDDEEEEDITEETSGVVSDERFELDESSTHDA